MRDTAVRLNYDILPIVVEFSEKKQVITQLTATRCNTLQCTATHGNTLDTAFLVLAEPSKKKQVAMQQNSTYCNTLQHTATHCNTLQHHLYCTATHFTHCGGAQKEEVSRNATQFNTMQHTAT